MRTMYDAVTVANIPSGATMVAAYANGTYANEAVIRSRFPHALVVRIAVRASFLDGHVLDVEVGDATPAQAVGWVVARRNAGADPTVYCNASTWPTVQAAFDHARVAQPHYWIARYDGNPTIPAGAVAKQYATGQYDTSSVADYWPGVDPTPTPPPEDPMATLSQVDADALIWRVEAMIHNRPTVAGGPTKGEANQLYQSESAQSAAITALSKLVATQHGLTVADVQNAVAAEMAKVVTVDVNVTNPTAS